MEFQNIVVGMDNSTLTDQAVACALEFAGRCDARIDVVHAVDLNKPHWFEGSGWDRVRMDILAQAKHTMNQRLETALAAAGRSELLATDLLHVLPGRPSQTLQQFASKTEASLLVLGGHHEHNLFDYHCTTREIVGRALCPVWIQNSPFRAIRRILVPVDLSPVTATVLDFVSTIATGFGARVHVINCFEALSSPYDPDYRPGATSDDIRSRQRLEFEKLAASPELSGRPHTTEFVEGEVAPTIIDRSADVDLIVMGTRGHTMMEQMMLGSQAYQVLSRARVPVVVVPQQREIPQQMTASGTG